MAREPELNSLDRYVKSSPRFVLEEHGHCEVPAGCGGAVLRWRNRFTSIAVELSIAVVGAEDWDVLIDGEPPRSARPLLSPGRHVLMIAVRGVVEGEFAFSVWLQSPDVPDGPVGQTPGPAGMWRRLDHPISDPGDPESAQLAAGLGNHPLSHWKRPEARDQHSAATPSMTNNGTSGVRTRSSASTPDIR